MKIVLASASPRRRELLGRLQISFEVIPAQGEEYITENRPSAAVVELARQKAGEIYEKLTEAGAEDEDILVMGADTVVCCDGVILGKPESPKAAQEMLRRLSGRTHQVYTGVSLWLRQEARQRQHSFFEKTDVTMYDLQESDIASGDYNNVVGLPVARLYQELKALGIETDVWNG